MTELSMTVLVSMDERERFEVLLPGVDGTRFSGISLSSLLDDVTLHLMEAIPKASPEDMPRYDFDPYVELRKVKVIVELGEKKDRTTWKGRLAVVISRWAEEDFYEVSVPRLGPERFAVRRLGELAEAVAARIVALKKRKPSFDLDAATCRREDFLQVLTFETDLPTILPSQPERRGRGMRKKRRKKAEAREKADKKKARRLTPPTELRAVGKNLTHLAMDGRLPRAFLREAIVQEVLEGLEREGAAILLVGPSGVGKTAIVGEVVRRLADKSTGMDDRREVWSVDGNRIISGMSYVGQWESRVQRIVHELSSRQDVLFVEDLPGLVFAGRTSQDETNVAGYLEPHLTRREVRIIGECTPERLLATKEEAKGFFERFTVIPVPELDERGTLICMAHAMRVRAEQEDLRIMPDGLTAILGLTRRFEPAAVNPGKSVRLLERLLAERGPVPVDDFGRRCFEREHVIRHFAGQSGLPTFVLWQEQARASDEVEAFFRHRIVAQPEAVSAAVDVVGLLEQGLNDPGRPLSSFLFIGPTGVGKTETAKALAELLFGDKDRLVRFDMSEFMAPHTVARLIGDRWHPEGELTRRVNQQPFSVVLLDEIEKAHPVVHDALLQVLGEGRLTNAAGQTVSFANTVVIMTSNLGVREANRRMGFEARDAGADELHFRRAAERHFRPEFFNRIDRIVPFAPLGEDAIVPLVERLLSQMLSRRGLRRSSVVVDVDTELVGVLVKEGFDPRYGARSIKRILEQRLAVPLARHLVAHRVSDLTIAELFPRGGGIEMALSTPARVHVEALLEIERPRTWEEADRWLAALRNKTDALRESTAVQALAEERAFLLDAVDSYESDPRTERVRTLADVSTRLDTLARCIVGLEESFEVEGFEEGVEREQIIPRNWNHHASVIDAPTVRLTHEVRPPFSAAHAEAVSELEMDYATIRIFAEALASGQDESLLVAVRPVGPEAASRDFAQHMLGIAGALWSEGGAGSSWLSATYVVRRAGRFEEVRSRAALSQLRADEREPCEVQAVLLEGPGARRLLEPELGLHLDVVELGPDRISRLVRMYEIGGAGTLVERVEADEARLQRYQASRREQDVPSPLNDVALAREYEAGRSIDPASGVEIALGSPWTLRRASLMRLVAEAKEGGR